MSKSSKLHYRYSISVFVYVLIVLGFRFFGGKFLVDFYDQPLKDIGESYFYWLSILSFFPNYIIHHYWACLFVDTLVVILPILCIFFYSKYIKVLTMLFLLLFWIQTSTVEIFTLSHSKSVVCIFLVILPILFIKKKFLLMIDFARYAGAYFIVSAAYFKYANGALLKKGNYSIALVNQYYDRAIMNPEHFLFQIATYIIDRPWLGDILFRMLFLSQVLFVLTFFTRKLDKLLVVNLFLFSTLTYVFMGIYNYDIFILSIPLFFSSQVSKELNLKMKAA